LQFARHAFAIHAGADRFVGSRTAENDVAIPRRREVDLQIVATTCAVRHRQLSIAMPSPAAPFSEMEFIMNNEKLKTCFEG
jgi:hypothetical protein